MGEREQFDVEFFRQLKSGGVIRVRLDVDRGQVTAFTLQLEIYADGRWRPVVRYDSAHGQPHRDLLDGDGHGIDKFWLSPTMTNKEAVRFAEIDLSNNAATYVAVFLERKP
jgi:hypothetical protein